MSKIQALSPLVVAQIAAGEVIERPAFAVKELLENALDAGATQISIVLEESGLHKIVVHDNGEGMSKEDLEVSFLPHTTSKLSSADDLKNISTLGFRGEALNSISVSGRLSIHSRKKGIAAGYQIVVEDGKLIESHKIGMAEGTTVVIEELFANAPVRKKFLKSAQTELRFILDIVTQIALAWPSVHFRLSSNGKLIINIPATENESDRIEALFGEMVAPHLLPVVIHEGEVSVKGYISKPLAERLPQKQFYIVNKRSVRYQLFSTHLKFAYGSLLEPRRFPFVVLYLTLPPYHIDANIHPRKEQLSLLNDYVLAELLQKTVIATLQQNNLTYMPEYGDTLHDGGTKTYAAKVLRKEVNSWGKEFTEWKTSGDVLQVHNLYLIVQTKKGMMMVDQHAAHERILYEQYKEEFVVQKEKKEFFELAKAIVFETGFSEAETLREYLAEFQNAGFDIEEFGTNLFKINGVPKLLQDRDPVSLLLEIVEDIQSGLGTVSIDAKTNRMLSFLACRTAIKSGDKLTKEQSKDLIKKLEECKTQYTCPHGRPVKVEIPVIELEKLFRRR
jgi:DNA mismatch repair protein MutL